MTAELMPLRVRSKSKHSLKNEIKSEGEMPQLQKDEPTKPTVEGEIPPPLSKSMSET